MSSWWHAAVGSLVGTGVGAAITGLVAERHARKQEQQLVVGALAAIRTELVVGMNRVTAAIGSASAFIESGQIPPITDDISLMYRTHAAVLHARLFAKDLLMVAAAYSWLTRCAHGGYVSDVPSHFVAGYGLYMDTVYATYQAYVRLGEILKADYESCKPSEPVAFALPADLIAGACDQKLKTLPKSENKRAEREGIQRVKTLVDWMKTDLQKRGFEEPGIIVGRAKP